MVHIKTVLDGALRSCRSDADVDLLHVWRLWKSAVGEVIAENARPAAFKGRLLLVHTESAAWIHQLQFLKADLIARLNEALGRELVGDIKFKIGAEAPPSNKAECDPGCYNR
jgi:predicted nucleic acid-binding Zn ribbon protein